MTMQEQVLAHIRESITSGALRPGSQLIQEELAHEFAVSRVPVREALRALTAEGLVEHFPHRGFFVAELSVADLAEVYQLRALIERDVLVKAASLITPDDAHAIEQLLREVEGAHGPAAVAEANRRFHFAIFDVARSPRALRLLEQLWDATDAYRAMYFALPESGQRIASEHRELWRAVAQGDGARAAAIQDTHRHHAEVAVSELLQGRTP